MLKSSSDKASKDSVLVQGSTKTKNNKKGIWSTVITVLIVIMVVVAVFFSCFYLVIHNNINGLGEKCRPIINGIPVIRLALPAVSDLTDPGNLTRDELLKEYLKFKKENADLTSKLENSKKKIDELSDIKAAYDKMKGEIDKTNNDLLSRQTELDQKQSEIDQYKKQVDAIVANGDTAGFKQFFEKLDPEVAKQVYSEIVVKQVADEKVKKFAQLYETMDSASAAQIFEKMGSKKIDMIAEALMAMKKESSSAILAAMTPDFASQLTEKLNALYKGK